MNNMSIFDNLQDCINTQGKFTDTFLPTGSAKFLDRNFSILPFLCELLKNANDSTIDPLLVKPPEFDITPYTDVSGLTAIGDPRFSLGAVMSATYVNFLPRMIAQTEMFNSGGTQVIDNYICDSDGNPIKQSETLPILLSLDLTGQKPYNYGAIYVPPLSAGTTLEHLLTPIQPQEIEFFVLSNIKTAIESTAQNFVNFIYRFFGDWSSTLYLYSNPSTFMVELQKNNPSTNSIEKVFLKFHSDSVDSVAKLLGKTTIVNCLGVPQIDSIAASRAYSDIPLDYNDAFSSPTSLTATYNYIMANYLENNDNKYSKLFADPASLQAYYNQTVANVSGNTSVCAVSSLP